MAVILKQEGGWSWSLTLGPDFCKNPMAEILQLGDNVADTENVLRTFFGYNENSLKNC